MDIKIINPTMEESCFDYVSRLIRIAGYVNIDPQEVIDNIGTGFFQSGQMRSPFDSINVSLSQAGSVELDEPDGTTAIELLSLWCNRDSCLELGQCDGFEGSSLFDEPEMSIIMASNATEDVGGVKRVPAIDLSQSEPMIVSVYPDVDLDGVQVLTKN